MKDLVRYAQFLATIRTFFMQENILEVQTKSLLNYPTFDANIDSIQVDVNKKIAKKSYYLHSSPELEMKKLLASGSGDIYQICKVYRDNEIGQRNFNEFTMLEYYKLGIDELKLSKNVVKLLNFVGISGEVARFSYREIFQKFAGFEVNTDFQSLKNIATQHQLSTDFDNIADLQDLLFVHFVEQKLQQFDICIIYDYPASQSALAKVEDGIAKRFEIYIKGVEVANGYKELTTADEYRQRLSEQGGTNPEFIQSLQHNLPECSGVALGVDRIFSQLIDYF
jgi:lysyl-tRNA synthetase class 2